jgi:hypothetical protein
MKTKIKRSIKQFAGKDKRVVFYPDTVEGWRKYLIITFSLIGFMTVFVWSMGVFYQAIRFWIIEPKSIVVFNKMEKMSVTGEVSEAASNGALDGGPGQTINEEEEKGISSSSAPQIENEVKSVFGNDAKVALAIFKTESGLNPRAMNWNCRYNGVSQQCKPEDRNNAWSVDCGIAQINVPGKACPEELFDYKNNIHVARSDLFDRRGFQPWVTFNEGYYLANL